MRAIVSVGLLITILLLSVLYPLRVFAADDNSGGSNDGGGDKSKGGSPEKDGSGGNEPPTDNPSPPPTNEPSPDPNPVPDPVPPVPDPCHDNIPNNCGSHGSGSHHSSGIHLASAKKGKSLAQIPSVKTDFPDNDPSAIQVHVTSAKKDFIGDYHMVGEITNNGTEQLQFVQVTGHLFDENGLSVGVTTCCYTTPTDIEPGHTVTFDSFAQKDHLSGKPTSFRLSYDWQ